MSIKKYMMPFILFIELFAFNAKAQISIGISVRVAPPAMPVYVQPACPTDGYLWVPGYWAYNDDSGYYWVPGVWVAPPRPGYLWTPAYWGYENGYYGFHRGYWGLHVGYYGGINYGYGYGGSGFVGGAWSGGSFRYNTAVVNVNTTVVRNVYVDRTVVNNTTINNTTINNNRSSFNGPGGVTAQPRPEERAYMNEKHFEPTSEQLSHEQVASKDRSQFASVNNGHPAAAAMNKVGGQPFNERGRNATNTSFNNPNNRVNSSGFGNARSNAVQPNSNGQANNANHPQPNQPVSNQAVPNQAASNQPVTNQAQPNRMQQNRPQPQPRALPQRVQPMRVQQPRPQQPHNNPHPAFGRHR
jgi:hypothetical protein